MISTDSSVLFYMTKISTGMSKFLAESKTISFLSQVFVSLTLYFFRIMVLLGTSTVAEFVALDDGLENSKILETVTL